MALVALSVVEQRLDAVRAVLAGASVTEVAAQVGVSRQSVHMWVGRYLSEGIGGLADRSSRPASCPHQSPGQVERAVAELRREHPRWGAKRIRLELLRAGPAWQGGESLGVSDVPSTSTINRILRRQGLVKARPRKRPRDSYLRFERPGPMQLWGIDIVGGIELVNPVTGELREAKIVTGVDDHSRYCVMAKVVERATARAVCLAFAEALARYGVPEEVISDNGKQFTDRFSRYGPSRGEVLFDKICRKNGITHRLTSPASPNQNGKVERFHGTFRPEISELGPFESLAEAQAAVDAWVAAYNAERPHQALDERVPVVPADRFAPADPGGLELWLPTSLEVAPAALSAPVTDPAPGPGPQRVSRGAPGSGGPIELDLVVPPSGNMWVRRQQFWLGPGRASQVVRFWIDCEWVHLSIGGQRIKSLRSRFSVADLDVLAASTRTKVLMLTTYGLDEYVYAALRAGAAGFMLKTEPPARLCEAVHIVAAGDALLGSETTRLLIERYLSEPPAGMQSASRLDDFTSREQEVLLELAQGRSNEEIGRVLFIERGTVKTHLTHILTKLGLRDRVQAVVFAYETGAGPPRRL